jgi:hypothetical protein
MTVTVSPLWRFLVTDLGGSSITLLDHLASDRTVTPKLNDPMEITGTVPSDSDYVQRLHTDNFPLVSEGVRQLYCFRRESETKPYYTVRGSGLIMQIQDASNTGDARSRFTSWDPWQYLYSRPCLQSALADDPDPGELIPSTNQLYPASVGADQIVIDMLFNMLTYADFTAPTAAQEAFLDWGITGFYTGTIETCPGFTGGWPVQQGTSVGQALKDLCDSGYLDIVFEPIYDPSNRPGILSQVSIYQQTVDSVGNITKMGAGSFQYNAVFAWDRPGRNMVTVDNLYDGTGRANHIQYYNGQGGPPVTPLTDPDSIALYGEYWAQQFFPANTEAVAVNAVAAMQLALRKTFKETLTVSPSAERAPEPFVDYYIGDAVPVYVGLGQRGTTPGDSRMRQSLPPGYTGAAPSPDPFTIVWQRIYGIPVNIDDNSTELVQELIVGPVGAPPPAPGSGNQAPAGMAAGGAAIGAERRGRTQNISTTTITPGGVNPG